ncbi:MAG: hypothetical protein JNK14_06730 [Chitinophagaceae bacterium]|nr:hypothetical protein [Chitinophagaceae bacterium]
MDEYVYIDYTNGAIASIDRPELFEKYNHTFFHFNSIPNPERLNYLSLLIASHFFGSHYKNIGKLKSDLTLKKIEWIDPSTKQKKTSSPVNYKIIRQHLQKENTFNHIQLELPELVSFWMDRSIDVAMNFYYKGDGGEIQIKDELLSQQYGDNFPITPRLNQEGVLITSFLPLITKRIAHNRKFLVTSSHLFHTSEWLFSLKSIINDTVSLVDISLNQLYLKAFYHKKPEWSFDLNKVGLRHGRRLLDKLKWVKSITGNELKIEKESSSLINIKDIRNHLNHFDPPVFVATLNEVCIWLNEIINIIKIVIRIRLCCGEPINRWLIELYLQPDVTFKPFAPRNNDTNDKNFGYNSVKYST